MLTRPSNPHSVLESQLAPDVCCLMMLDLLRFRVPKALQKTTMGDKLFRCLPHRRHDFA